MKTFVITISRQFPKSHKNAGAETYFINAITGGAKLHTIRANYKLWNNRIEEVLDGKAQISLRFWTDKPYGSKQGFIKELYNKDGIGCQKLLFLEGDIRQPHIETEDGLRPVTIEELAANDGLSVTDWLEWFKSYDLKEPLAVIHFTKFRY